MIRAQINNHVHSIYRQCIYNKNGIYSCLVNLSRNCSQKKVKFSENETHFGFQKVKEEEKERKVHEVFETVAENYDKMNDAMSFGIHRMWKDEFIERLSPTSNTKLLDVAGGTGDISFRYLRYLEMVEGWKPSNLEDALDSDVRVKKVTICDINEAMLKVGRLRAIKLGYKNEIHWVLGNAESLPFDDNSYSAYTIAFGIRNVTHIQKALHEAYRVLCPGGRFMCLEFSRVNNDILRRIYDEYSLKVIPAMGLMVAGEWKPYQYLVESIRRFPNQDDFMEMIRAAGFQEVTYENMTCGVIAIHSGFKL